MPTCSPMSEDPGAPDEHAGYLRIQKRSDRPRGIHSAIPHEKRCPDGNSLILQTHFYGWKQIRNVRLDGRRAQTVAEIDLYLRMMDAVFRNFLSGIRQKLPAPVRSEEHFVSIGASCPHLKNAKFLYHFLRHFIEHRVVCPPACACQKPSCASVV